MGFFSDLKEDLNQAVNEMLPEEKKAGEEQFDTADKESVEELEAILSQPVNEVMNEERSDRKDKGRKNKEEQKENSVIMEETVNNMNEVVDETAVITKGMVINGNVDSNGNLDVIGSIKGDINILGKLNITGEITGNSDAAEVYAEAAHVTGEVRSRGSVKIGQSSVIIGNISATSAVIAGAVKGDIDVKGPVILDTSAIVMGDIKSKSVQINNGAVIEGKCSQCYAEVNPISFFDDYSK